MDRSSMAERRPCSIIYGTAWKKGDTARLVRAAAASGFTAFDTANQPKHYSEPLVGEAISALVEAGVERDSLFVQTKFTPIGGQDSNVPYDPRASISEQVRQSFSSSLENLSSKTLDSYLLHGPYSFPGLGDEDWEAWRSLEELYAQGKVRAIGISNVNERQLAELINKAEVAPHAVQNRCYASRGWDREVRSMCLQNGIIYQAFSLLTANMQIVSHPEVQTIASRLEITPAQVIYRFSQQAGMVPLTGTTNERHMSEALAIRGFSLEGEDVKLLENLGANL